MELYAILISMSCLKQRKPRSKQNEDMKVYNSETVLSSAKVVTKQHNIRNISSAVIGRETSYAIQCLVMDTLLDSNLIKKYWDKAALY
jgi:hypothetical protein